MGEDCKQEDVELNLCNKIREHINNFGWQSLILDCHQTDITPISSLINSSSSEDNEFIAQK